jgi:hypothetical protein
VLIKNGLKELLWAAPQREYAVPFESRLLPLKESIGAKQLKLEILKTGCRMWVTVFFDPKEKTLQVDEFMKIKERLRTAAREVDENTQTEVILDPT